MVEASGRADAPTVKTSAIASDTKPMSAVGRKRSSLLVFGELRVTSHRSYEKGGRTVSGRECGASKSHRADCSYKQRKPRILRGFLLVERTRIEPVTSGFQRLPSGLP